MSMSQRKRLSCNTEPTAMEAKRKMERRSAAAPRPGKESNGNSLLQPDRALKPKNVNTELLKQRETDKESRPLAKRCAETERRLRAVESELRRAEDKLQTGARERNALTARAAAAERRATELQRVNDMLRAKFSGDELKSEVGKLCSELAELTLLLERAQQEKEQMKVEFEEQVGTLELKLQTSQTVEEPLKEEPKVNRNSDSTDGTLGVGEAAAATFVPSEGPALEQQLSGLMEERANIERGLRAVLAGVDELQGGDARLEELVERMAGEAHDMDEELGRLRAELDRARESAEEQTRRLQERVEELEREATQGPRKAPPKTPRRRVTLLAAEAGSELARNVEGMEAKLSQVLSEMSAIQRAYKRQVGDSQPPAGVVTRSQSVEPPRSTTGAAAEEPLTKIPPLHNAQAENKLSTEAVREDLHKWKMMYDKSGARAMKVASPLLGRLSRLRLADRGQRSFYPTFVEERINAAGKRSANTAAAMRCFTGANQVNRQNMFV